MTTVPQEVIDRAYAEDEASARAEYGAQFRLDVESFVSREAVDSAVIPGRRRAAPRVGVSATSGFLDFRRWLGRRLGNAGRGPRRRSATG